MESGRLDEFQQVVALVFHLANVAQTQGDRLDERITTKQWMALISVFHLEDGRATCSEVARLMGCTKQNAKQLMDALVRKGYLATAANPADRRAVLLQPTQAGATVASELYARRADALGEAAGILDGDETRELHRLLRKLADGLTPGWDGYERAAAWEARA